MRMAGAGRDGTVSVSAMVLCTHTCSNSFRAYKEEPAAGAGSHSSEGFIHGASPCHAKKAAGSVGKAGL